MSDTKRVILRVPMDLPADGVHCGGCVFLWLPYGTPEGHCLAWRDSGALARDLLTGGLLRCPECLAAEEKEVTT